MLDNFTTISMLNATSINLGGHIMFASPSVSEATLFPESLSWNPDKLHSFLCHRFQRFTPSEQAGILANTWRFISRGSPGLCSKSELKKIEALAESERLGRFALYLSQGTDVEKVIINLFFSVMRTYHPAFLAAINVILNGGSVGILSARKDQEGSRMLVRELGDFLGYEIPEEHIYFVNDPSYREKAGDIPTTAGRKLQVLLNYLEESGAKFRKVILVDDEDANVEAVLQHYGGHVCSSPLRELEKARLRGVPEEAVYRGWRKHAFQVLDPDSPVLRIEAINAKNLSPEKEFHAIVKKLRRGAEPGDTDTIIFLDIDGTCVSLDESIHVRSRLLKDPVISIPGKEFSCHPDCAWWINEAARRTPGVDRTSLFMDFSDFYDPERINRGLEDNRIFRRCEG